MQIVERINDTEASEKSLQAFEKEIGGRLPSPYRQFLLTTNGGRPQRVEIVFETDDGTSDSLVNWFYTLSSNECYGLIENHACFNERIPSNMIAIAEDPFGNQFLLAIDDGRGGVYFWDHELELEEDVNNVYLVDNSFEEFAKMFP